MCWAVASGAGLRKVEKTSKDCRQASSAAPAGVVRRVRQALRRQRVPKGDQVSAFRGRYPTRRRSLSARLSSATAIGSVALPSMGRALTRTTRAPSCSPPTSGRAKAGLTRMAIRKAG